MAPIFEFTNYREYLKAWVKHQGKGAYGLKGRWAAALGVSSTLISLVLKGEKSFTPDQASNLSDTLGLIEIEADYLLLLVEHDRASDRRYREKVERKVKALQVQSRQIGKRVPRTQELTDEQRSIYYSSWLYTGVRNLSAITNFDNVDAIAKRLHVDPSIVQRVVRFLIENGLCKEEAGKITYGPASTHVDRESPFVNKHHQNWRFQAIQTMERRREDDIFFTSPMSLSKAAAEEIRSLLLTAIQSATKTAAPSDSEMVACLNVDWFEY